MLEDYNVVHFTIHLDSFKIVIYNKRIRDLNHFSCIFCLHPNLHSPVGPVHNNCWQKLVWSLKCFEGCINSNVYPVWPILDYLNPNKKFRFLIFQTWVQVLEAVHSRCISRFLSNQHFEIFLEYSRIVSKVYLQFKGNWLFKCRQNGQIFDFSSFWSSLYQMHNQIVE